MPNYQLIFLVRFNKATQQRTAPGSTLKILSTVAGMSEGVIDDGTYIECTGSFDLVTPPINCWNKQGHGALDIRGAIGQSCNVFSVRSVLNLERFRRKLF